MEVHSSELQEDIIQVSDCFYQNRIQNGIDIIPEFIQKLMTFSSQIKQEDVQGYTYILKNIMETMESKDYILLADLLVFELQPLLSRY